MVLAVGLFTHFVWAMDEAYGDLRRAGIQAGPIAESRGSNQFAIAPSRSAEGAAILASDPHLGWHGQTRWWEFRIHAGSLEGSGVNMAGGPYIAIGHSRHLAWAYTTGGPDIADVYELVVDDDRPHHYLYDGQWRAMTSRQLEIEVRGAATQSHTVWFSHHGPIVARHDGKAYAAKISNVDVLFANELTHELNFGTDYQAAVRGLGAQTMVSQNVMVADTSGNIYYHRAGRVPRRPPGYDWSLPVDGSTSATEWLGFHPSSDNLQVLNPKQGYMQNCNIPPDAMIVDSPFDPEDHLPYLFASHAYGAELSGWTNQRGARALELLAPDDSVTAADAIAIVNDVVPYGADRWIEALRRADEKLAGEKAGTPFYREALDEILSWDRKLEADSTGALVYDFWRRQLLEDLGEERLREIASGIDDWYAIVEGETRSPLTVTEDAERAFLSSFATAAGRLVGQHGDLTAVYGDRHRVGRGDRSWPVGGGGGSGLLGTSTLRVVRYLPEREDGTVWGESGQTSTQVVVLTDPPRSWIYVPLGQSDRPDSPHYSDQAAGPFSHRQLKPSWWQPEELVGHIESRTVLEGVPGGSSR